jgi:hypothetical protein
MNLPLSILWFVIGFIAVNGLKLFQIQRKVQKLRLKPENPQKSESELIKAAYQKSQPYVPGYYLLVWIVCSTFYFLLHNSPGIYKEALMTGALWWLLTLLLEMVVWVKSSHKYQLTWKEMYMNSQPWLSLNYYAVLISPLILSMILK